MRKRFFCLFCFFNGLLFAIPQSPPTGTYGNCPQSSNNPTVLKIIETEITVNGKPSKVYDVLYNDKEKVIRKTEGDCFDLLVVNETSVPTGIHWHGLILPNPEDGVPYITQPPIQPGDSYYYNFKMVQSGTYWAHTHYGLQEQKLMGLPLILGSPSVEQTRDIVLFFEGFIFQTIDQVWQGLRKNFMSASSTKDANWIPPFDDKKIPLTNKFLNDVYFDAFLTNRKTLDNPDVCLVKPNEKIRLRLINGSASSGFHLDLGSLPSKVIAVDGNPVIPFNQSKFPIATAQRVDVIVTIPESGGVFPIFAQCEGRNLRTGAILKTEDIDAPKYSQKASIQAKAISNQFEKKLHAVNPLLQKPVDRTLQVDLVGNMQYYVWGMNNHIWPNNKPLKVKEGERVEVILSNKTPMAHPIHLHGHVFQVTAIDGEKLVNGAMRDTILVLPYQSVTLQFDANNPGVWAFHCHMIYHLWGGMLTVIQYEGYDDPVFPKIEIFDYSRRYGGY